MCYTKQYNLVMMSLGRLVVVTPHGSHDIVRRPVCVLAVMPPKLVQLITMISCWFCFCKMVKDVLTMLLLLDLFCKTTCAKRTGSREIFTFCRIL